MKKLTIKKGEKTASLAEIEEFQDFHDIVFPEQLTTFLTTQNPINTLESCFFVKGREPYDISFFPFSTDSSGWTIQKAFKNLNDDFFEGKYLSFGSDSGGWQYVVSIQESDYGKVYFCRMDEELEDALTLLADSFEEFINGLQEPPEEWKNA